MHFTLRTHPFFRVFKYAPTIPCIFEHLTPPFTSIVHYFAFLLLLFIFQTFLFVTCTTTLGLVIFCRLATQSVASSLSFLETLYSLHLLQK